MQPPEEDEVGANELKDGASSFFSEGLGGWVLLKVIIINGLFLLSFVFLFTL